MGTTGLDGAETCPGVTGSGGSGLVGGAGRLASSCGGGFRAGSGGSGLVGGAGLS